MLAKHTPVSRSFRLLSRWRLSDRPMCVRPQVDGKTIRQTMTEVSEARHESMGKIRKDPVAGQKHGRIVSDPLQ
jgi:hypothetical protein